MRSKADQIDRALQASSRAKLRAALGSSRAQLNLPEINRLAQRLATFDEPWIPLRLAVLRSYTAELLRPYWNFEALLNGFDLDLYEAPYGSVLQEARGGSGLVGHAPDVTYIFLRWEDLDPRLDRPLSSLSGASRDEAAGAALDHLRRLLGGLRDAVPGLLVLTLLPRFSGPGLGAFDAMAAESEARFRSDFKHRLAEHLRDAVPAAQFHDLDAVAEEVGRTHLFDTRMWLSSRFPFTVTGAQAVVRRLMTYPVLLKQPRAKCIALDADNTLWGGIVGEDGPGGIALGPDYPGSAFLAFQRRLLDFQGRGLLLALCSKNNPADVEEILSSHPHMLLRAEHFSAVRVNWGSKAENLRDLALELNLGLDAFVFVDDSPHECLAIQQQLPQVTVVTAPPDVTELPSCLSDLPQLEILSLTDEDRRRTEIYAQERRRRQLAEESRSLDDYLASLEMAMTIGLDDSRHVGRVAQLTQKTNQFNLTTSRYTEADVRRFVDDPDWLVAHFALVDIFGDSGIVGVALARGLLSGEAEIDTFLMSCRVIGRQAEVAFLAQVLVALRRRGVARVRAAYLPTSKNALVSEFWPRHGFRLVGEGAYEADLAESLPFDAAGVPIRIQLDRGLPADAPDHAS